MFFHHSKVELIGFLAVLMLPLNEWGARLHIGVWPFLLSVPY